MARRTSAKAWFEARGWSEESKGIAAFPTHVWTLNWPKWAKRAYLTGALNQFSWMDLS